MTAIDINALQAAVLATLKAELRAIETGERRLGVAHQHYGYVLESAIEHCTVESLSAFIADMPGASVAANHLHAIDWAHLLSEFEAPELDSCWVD